jgi:hypothetical protein
MCLPPGADRSKFFVLWLRRCLAQAVRDTWTRHVTTQVLWCGSTWGRDSRRDLPDLLSTSLLQRSRDTPRFIKAKAKSFLRVLRVLVPATMGQSLYPGESTVQVLQLNMVKK